MANSLKLQIQRLGQDPPLAGWLIALSHDSPFEPIQANAARGVFCQKTSPSLTAAGSLLSLLKDFNRAVRLRAVTALGDLWRGGSPGATSAPRRSDRSCTERRGRRRPRRGRACVATSRPATDHGGWYTRRFPPQ